MCVCSFLSSRSVTVVPMRRPHCCYCTVFPMRKPRLHAGALETTKLSGAAANGATVKEASGCHGQGAGSVTCR